MSREHNTPTANGLPLRKKALNTIALIALGFFWISGGMYGNEELMLTTAPAHALWALLLVPVLEALPLILITTELACAMPWEGGPVAWTEEGLGKRVGAHNAYWTWLSYAMDASLYPRFAAAYLTSYFELGSMWTGVFAMVIVGLVTLTKLRGTHTVVSLEMVLGVLVAVPSLIFMGYGLPHADTHVMTEVSGDTDWGNLITWVLWLYSGVISVGSVASEVQDPKRSYLTSVYCLLTFDVLLINFAPLWVSLSVDGDRANYTAGHFAQLAGQLAGKWLQTLITISAQISQIGIYGSMSLAADRYLASLCHAHIFPAIAPLTTPGTSTRDSDSSSIPSRANQRNYGTLSLPPKLVYGPPGGILGQGSAQRRRTHNWGGVSQRRSRLQHHSHVSAVIDAAALISDARSETETDAEFSQNSDQPTSMGFTLFNASIHMCLVWLPIISTLELSILLDSINTLLFLTAFLRLKHTRPDLPRTYKTPGGLVGAYLITLPCAMLGLVNLALAMARKGDTTVVPLAIVFLLAVIGSGLLVECVIGWWTNRFAGQRSSRVHTTLQKSGSYPQKE